MMKRIFMLVLATLALAACNDSTETVTIYPTENTHIVDGQLNGRNMHFYGTLEVTPPQGEKFTEKNAYFEMAGGDKTFTLYMHKTRFVAAMPAFEMRLRSLTYTGNGNAIYFTAESFFPEAWIAATSTWEQQPKRAITDLTGSVSGVNCQVSFTCMGMNVIFTGKLVEFVEK